MKIVIVSEDGLPDIRVEKLIKTLLSENNEIHFIGKYKGYTGIFDKTKIVIHDVKWTKYVNYLIEPYYSIVKKKVHKILKKINPNIVIAINLVAGKITLEFVRKEKIPMILDYHEVWSLMTKYVEANKLKMHKNIASKLRKKIYSKLEKELLSQIPFMTISYNAAKYFNEKYGVNEYIIVKNYPSIKESENISVMDIDCSIRRYLFIGKDLVYYTGRKYRDLRATVHILNRLWNDRKNFEVLVAGTNKVYYSFVRPLGYIAHMKLYNLSNKVHYGILSYVPVPIQKYFSPNKAYIYAHIGAIPIVTDTLEEAVSDLGTYILIVNSENYDSSLYAIYKESLDIDCVSLNKIRRQIHNYARKELVWEKFDKDILSFIKKYA